MNRYDIEDKLVSLGFSKELADNTSLRIFNDSRCLHEAFGKLTDEQLEIIAENFPEALDFADWHGKIISGRRYNRHWYLITAQVRADKTRSNEEPAQLDI